jgi:hypothetical protein
LLLFMFCLEFFNKIFWRYSPLSYMFRKPYFYLIHQCILHIFMHAFIKVWTQFSWRCTKVFTTKPIQDLDKIERKCKFITFDIKLFKKFKLQHMFCFSNFIQMLQMKTWSQSLFNNIFMKIIIIYNYTIWRLQKRT